MCEQEVLLSAFSERSNVRGGILMFLFPAIFTGETEITGKEKKENSYNSIYCQYAFIMPSLFLVY